MKFTKLNFEKTFSFEVSCNHLKLTKNKKFIAAVGIYKPSIKIFDLLNIGEKLERHFLSDAIKVLPLEDDGTKLAILRDDRHIEFHAKYGYHEKIRLPTKGYNMCLNEFDAEIISGGLGKDVYRFNLDQGRFLRSYTTNIEEVNTININPINGLIGIGGEKKIHFVDKRSKNIIKTIYYEQNVTALDFSETGLEMGVGTITGESYYHDLRSRKELQKVDHSSKILDIKFSGTKMLSLDEKSIKILDKELNVGEFISENKINTFDCDGGLICVGQDNGEVNLYISEDLGIIPNWCKTEI